MRYAVVDTGSNTIRMSVYECESGKTEEIFTEAIFANLAGHIKNNQLTTDGINACCEAILKHKETAQKYGIDHLHVFATAAIRNAENAEEIKEKVKINTSVDMKILSGDDEGELSFLGAVDDFLTDDGIMADVGGGSSEIIAFSKGRIEAVKSIPLGSLKAYKAFVSGEIPTSDEVVAIKNEIKKHLEEKSEFKSIKTKNLCLVGGNAPTAKKLSQLFLNKEPNDTKTINLMLSLFVAQPEVVEILEKTIPKRKLTITPGLAIYSAVAEYFGAENIYISDKGIKEGYLKKYLL